MPRTPGRVSTIRHALTGITFALSVMLFTASAKDDITNNNGTPSVPTAPGSTEDFELTPSGGGTYTHTEGGGGTVSGIELITNSSDSGEWWVSSSSTDPWANVESMDDQFAYHLQSDIAAGGTFWAGISTEYQIADATSSFRQTDGQLRNGTTISFGFSDDGSPALLDSGDIDNVEGLSFQSNTGPDAADFATTATFTWFTYNVTGGAATQGNPSGDDLRWALKPDKNDSDPDYFTEFVVFVDLADGVSIDADGGTYIDNGGTLSDERMEGLQDGGIRTDEIVFNWTLDAKNDELGGTNSNFGPAIGVPEPAVGALFGLVGLAFALRRRR